MDICGVSCGERPRVRRRPDYYRCRFNIDKPDVSEVSGVSGSSNTVADHYSGFICRSPVRKMNEETEVFVSARSNPTPPLADAVRRPLEWFDDYLCCDFCVDKTLIVLLITSLLYGWIYCLVLNKCIYEM